MQTYGTFRPTSHDPAGLGLPDRQHWFVAPVYHDRDSEPLAESNWHTLLTRLGGESDTVEVHRFGHWGPGWFEVILIDPTDMERVKVATEAGDSLESYPVLDEEDLSEREEEVKRETWANASIRDRMHYLRDLGLSCLAARHATLDEFYTRTGYQDNGTLGERLLSH